jgi:two-component system chemotaxis sensor kinase CheA
MSAEDEFLAIFRDEAKERLDGFTETLLAVEAGAAGDDALELLFRDVHTIKGAAAMVGLTEISAGAHAIEDVLGEAREAGHLDIELVEPLLRAADALRRQTAGAGARNETAPESATGRSIRVSSAKLDALLGLVGETILHRRRLEHLVRAPGSTSHPVDDELDAGDRLLAGLKSTATALRTMPLSVIVGPYARSVRDVAAAEAKDIDFVVTDGDMELDRTILETLADPLAHLLRNAVAHGIEKPDARRAAGKPSRGRVELRAQQRGAVAQIVVEDDGSGVAPDLLARGRAQGSLVDVLAEPGFSTADAVSPLAGRGVGLDAVKAQVEAVGGSLAIESEAGVGTRVTLSLPLTLALLDVLLVERGDNVFGIPLSAIVEAVVANAPLSLEGRARLDVHGTALPLVDLAALVGFDAPAPRDGAPAVVVGSRGVRVAAVTDRLLGETEVVLKPFGPLLGALPGYLGAAILGDGRVAPLLDPIVLVSRAAGAAARPVGAAAAPEARKPPKVLVVEDSFTVRELQRTILEVAGYRVATAHNGRDALEQVLSDGEIDLVLTDVDMPELDGIGLTAAIRASDERAALPVVIVTSRADEDHRRQGAEAGADAYMVKSSYDQQALLETVQRLVGS